MTALPNPFNDLCAVPPSAEPVAATISPTHPLVGAATDEFTMSSGPVPFADDIGMPDIPAFLDRRRRLT